MDLVLVQAWDQVQALVCILGLLEVKGALQEDLGILEETDLLVVFRILSCFN